MILRKETTLIKSTRLFFIETWVVLFLSLGVLAVNTSPTQAAPPAQGPLPGNSLWRDVNEAGLRGQETRLIIPDKYRLLAADIAALDNLLGQAPLEGSLSSQSVEVVLVLPLPDGNFGRFRIEESPIMEPALALNYPEIKTYRGWSLDDPLTTAYLDRTPAGFHGMILSSSDTVYIDPYQRNDITHYLSYFKQDYGNFWKKSFQEGLSGSSRSRGISVAASAGPTLHTYRLAMATTGEYAQFHGGTKANALAAINTTMNRVNGLYRRDLSIRMILVANTDQLIFTDDVGDPYTNDDGEAMLDENQATVNTIIGSANYDIGHVFSTAGGGVAILESVCSNPVKAQGVTGQPNPVGDPFDIDFVSHEMGHQFGADHTFNANNASSCSGTRSSTTAYEPGSGTTVMAYAGICDGQDLQPQADDNFHAISFDEITDYVTNLTPGSGGSCGSHTATGNAAPIVNAGANYIVPANTPFRLTGSASDPNNDTLTYQWEEFDLGSAWLIPGVLPNTDGDGNPRPIFRSYKPVSSPTRNFPALANILDGSLLNKGESLPKINRTMTFRLTVRDNKGGVNNDSMNVTVSNTSDPFRVTAPLAGTIWISATQQTVNWNVANTTAAPVNCATVNILFSNDDGSNFSYTLLTNTPNDGTATITAPLIGTNNGRVMVQCNGNVFFHISGRVTLFGIPPLETYLPIVVKHN
jgi:hypothetical protein